MKIAVTVCFICLMNLPPSESLTVEQKTKIRTFIDSLVSCRGIPGLTLAVVSGNDTWTEGFGLADIDNGVKVNKSTLFGIGSVTKAFTTTLLAMLLEESNGKFKWTSAVREILGEDFEFVDETRTKDLTLRDLATHRTGLVIGDFASVAGYRSNITREDIFKRRFRFLPAAKPFRDEFDYNNWCYGLLGYIVEVLAKVSYEETLRNRIFQPLGMTESRVLGQTVTPDDNNVAKPYMIVDNELIRTDSKIYKIYPVEPAGAIASSAEDMTKWQHFLLNDGKTPDNKTLISSKFLKETFKMHEGLPQPVVDTYSLLKPIYPVPNLGFGYGYAWFVSNYNGYKKIWHSGGLFSYVTNFILYPDLDLGIFTSVNGADSKTGTAQRLISFYITDLLMDKEPWLNTSTACTFPQPWHKAQNIPQNNSDVTNADVKCVGCYTGKYGHHFYGNAEVKVGMTQGTIDLTYGRIYGSLNSTTNETLFKLDIQGPYEFLSRPENKTVLVPIKFHAWDAKHQKYNMMVIEFSRSKLEFTRNVNFYDESFLIKENNSNQASGLLFRLWWFVSAAVLAYRFPFITWLGQS